MQKALEASETTSLLSSDAPQLPQPLFYGGVEGEAVDAPQSLSAGTEEEEYTWEEEEDDDEYSQPLVELSAPQRMCAAIKNAFVVIANVESEYPMYSFNIETHPQKYNIE